MRFAHFSHTILNQASAAGASKRARWKVDRLLKTTKRPGLFSGAFYFRAHIPYILVILVADSYEPINRTGMQYAGCEWVFMHSKQYFLNLAFQLLIYRPGDHYGRNARGS